MTTNTQDLLILAEVMRREVKLKDGKVSTCLIEKRIPIINGKFQYQQPYEDFIHYIEFNPSTEELLEWIFTKGYLTRFDNEDIIYRIYSTATFPGKEPKEFYSEASDAKQNILSIAVQVATYFEENK